MNCALISKMIGFECHPLTDDGRVALIDTPLKFTDGDDIPAYVELGSDFVRFFDDGDVFFHFLGRGVPVDDEGGAQFLSAIAASNGVSYSEAGHVELQAAPENAAAAFSKYMAAMSAFIDLEKTWETGAEGEIAMSMVK